MALSPSTTNLISLQARSGRDSDVHLTVQDRGQALQKDLTHFHLVLAVCDRKTKTVPKGTTREYSQPL